MMVAVQTETIRPRGPGIIARAVFRWIANLVGIWLAELLGLLTYGDDLSTLAVAALVLAAINLLLRPIVLLLSLPFIILSLGLFILVVNALMLWFTDGLVDGFGLLGFWHTIGAAIVISIANMLLHASTNDFNDKSADRLF